MQGTFKRDTPFEKRVQLNERIRKNYPDRVPVIVESAVNQKIVIKRRKFLAPAEITVGAFLMEIRKQTDLRPEEALFIFCGDSGVLAPTGHLMSSVYDKYKSDDGFLYITVAIENTFGGAQKVFYCMLDRVLNESGKFAKIFEF